MPHWTTFRRGGADPTAPGGWQEPDQAVHAALAAALEAAGFRQRLNDFRLRCTALDFHPETTLWELYRTDGDRNSPPVYVAQTGTHAVFLDGSGASLERLATMAPQRLDTGNVVDYVRFSFAFFREEGNAHLIVLDDIGQVRWRCATSGFDRFVVQDAIRPPGIVGEPDTGFDLSLTVLAGDNLKYLRVHVDRDGSIRIPDSRLALGRLPVVHDALDDFPSDTAALSLQAGWEPRPAAELPLPEDTALPDWPTDAGETGQPMVLVRPLAFLPDCVLTRAWTPDDTSLGRYLLIGRHGLYPLEGGAAPIHAAREQERFVIENAAAAIDYAIFFGLFTHGEQGPFRLLRVPSDLNVTRGPGEQPASAEDVGEARRWERTRVVMLRELIRPPAARRENGRWIVDAAVQYGADLFQTRFGIGADGAIEMLDDSPLLRELPADPAFDRFATTVQPAPAADHERLELAVHRAWLKTLLVHALRRGDAGPLFEAPDHEAEALLGAFAGFVFDTCPAIIAQSGLAWCERLLADLLKDLAGVSPPDAPVRSLQWEPGGAFVPQLEDGQLLTLSFHTLHKFKRPEHLAHLLGHTHAAALFGCDSLAAVPEPLRRIADVTLDLGWTGPRQFVALFCELFDCDWPDDLAPEEQGWTRYVLPGDFVQPLRHRRRSDEANPWTVRLALDEIRRRAEARLGGLQPRDGLRLDQIHGMDEARAVARDLIDEIQLALAGRLDWRELDRGFLLVGDPGTGKTLLARAIAGECGVRFIATSAADWISGTDHLGEHIEKIRACFAEARRYAPSILFIDEIDSLGNRSTLQDRHFQYYAEVINTVLQEIQGFDAGQPVFVIAATNHVANVDPALRRAGRLDQVIRVRRPNRAALAAILAHYLAPHRAQGNLAPGTDLDRLAGLAIGATGADIERFVRDAARRARKDGAPIDEAHLAAAITGQPRSLQTALGRPAISLANTALHEAGHTVAMLLCEHYPATPAFVSIVPDARGRLGFTASSGNSERRALTRAAWEELLAVMLAGRAAEEIAHGPRGVTSGAGGRSETSDLARATRLALDLEQRMGFTGQSLRWRRETPSADERRALSARLNEAYASIRARLQAHWPLVEAIAERLRSDFQVTGDELAALARQHGIRHG